MTGTFKYINWIIGLVLLLATACNDKDKVNPLLDEADGDGEEVVEIIFASPVTYATTIGGPTERIINELDILVFKNGEYQYRRIGEKSPASFRTTLKVDNGLTLYFIVNSRELLESTNVLVEGNNWDTDIRPVLIMNNPSALIGSTSLPMWAIRENVVIEEGIINQIDDIHLLRAVASVDVYNSTNPATFTLQEAWLYFVPDQGYLAPSATLYDDAIKDVNAPESPANMVTLNTKQGVNSAQDEKIEYKLYLYENDAPTTSIIPTKRYSRLVVGGSYKGGPTTYYPVDFYDDDLSNILQATRNYKYWVNITEVTSEGYPDPDTASEEADSRLIVDVIDWNMEDENDVIFEGPYFISVTTKQIYLYKPAGSTYQMNFTTNIPWEKIKKELLDSGNGTVVENTYMIRNDHFQIEILLDDNGEPEFLLFTALQDYDVNNKTRNFQTLRFSSSRIVFDITIEQVNESMTEWIDGGEKDVELGDDKKF